MAEQVEALAVRALAERDVDSRCVVLPALADEVAVLALDWAGDPFSRERQAFFALRRQLAERGLPVRVSAGGAQPLENAPESLAQARHALNYRLLRPDPVILYEEVKDQARYVGKFGPGEVAALSEALEQGREAEALAIAEHELCAIAEAGNASIASLQDALNRISGCMNRAVALSMGGAVGDADALPESLRVEDLRDWAALIQAVGSGIRRVCRLRAQASTSTAEVVARLERLIRERYAENISLRELAETRFFLNPSYLSRLFKAGTGVSFRQYLTDVRLDKACAMLRYPDMSVMRAASECGYGDASQFIQQFRKRFGVTPSVWRAKGSDKGQYGGNADDPV